MTYPGAPHGAGPGGPQGQQGQQPPGQQPPGAPPAPAGPPPPPAWTQQPQSPPGTTAPPGGLVEASPQTPQSGAPSGPPQKTSTKRKMLCIALSVFGGLALLGGGGMVAQAISNANQVIRNESEYGPVMWRNEPADKLFPKTLGGSKSVMGKSTDATDPEFAAWNRVGIAKKTGCDEGLDGALAATAEKAGCKAVLRATYVDTTGNAVATVALIVRSEGQQADNDMKRFFEDGKHGVKAYPVRGTIAAGWKDENRNGSGGEPGAALYVPYDAAVTAGAVDGRKSGRLPAEWHNSSGKSDGSPWQEAAADLAQSVSLYLGQLLEDVTSS